MVQLAHPEALANDLERGLGEVYWATRAFYPSLRLRMGVCGVTSVAMQQKFQEQGISTALMLSTPRLTIDEETAHVVPIIETGDGPHVVDTSYSQFLSYSGLVPGYVMFGGKDMYPKTKIVTFPVDQPDHTVSLLSAATHYFIRHRQPVPEIDWRKPEFSGLSEAAIEATYAEIWNPRHYTEFVPSGPTQEAGEKLARFISDEHVRLVA